METFSPRETESTASVETGDETKRLLDKIFSCFSTISSARVCDAPPEGLNRRAQWVCGTGESNGITVTSRPVITVANWQQQQQQADQRSSQPENKQADAIKGSQSWFHVILVIHGFARLLLTLRFRRPKAVWTAQPDSISPSTASRKLDPDVGL